MNCEHAFKTESKQTKIIPIIIPKIIAKPQDVLTKQRAIIPLNSFTSFQSVSQKYANKNKIYVILVIH